MDIKALTELMHKFVTAKGWYDKTSSRPQTLRNLLISLTLESSEALELMQWHDEILDKEALAGELADISLYLLQAASIAGIDLEQAILDKLETNYSRVWNQNENLEETSA